MIRFNFSSSISKFLTSLGLSPPDLRTSLTHHLSFKILRSAAFAVLLMELLFASFQILLDYNMQRVNLEQIAR